MDFSGLKDEFAARGVDYLSDERRGQYINWARGRLDAAKPWPYRKTSGTGTAGAGLFTADDLGVPYMVQDSRNGLCPLRPCDELELRRCYGDLSFAGTPWAYYVAHVGDTRTVTAYPVGGTLVVYYLITTPDLASPTDTPLSPDRYHGLIVDMAVQMAYRDSDDHAMAEQLQVWIDRQTQSMVDDLLVDQVQGPTYRVLPHRWENF